MSSFFFLTAGFNDAFFNMAVDEWLLKQSTGTFVRLYGWNPEAVSIGCSQKFEAELDLELLKSDGIDAVRRLTGGRAVLHGNEITYSVCGDIGGIFGDTLAETYEIIAQGLQQSFRNIGITTELKQGTVKDVRATGKASLPCFASTSRSEITLQGRKLVGSAQRREKKRFLQHGSIIISGKNRLVKYLRLNEGDRAAYTRELDAEAISLDEAGIHLTLENAEDSFVEGFVSAWKLLPIHFHLDPGSEIDGLRSKYLNQG